MTHETIKTFLSDLLAHLGVTYDSIDIETHNDQTIFQIHAQDSGTIIGTRGDVIKAINYLVKKAFEDKDDVHFLVDVNGYRTKKITELEETAKLLAERARSLKYNVEMNPMSSYERMIVHSALANEPNIRTESHGEGRDRRVVICFQE